MLNAATKDLDYNDETDYGCSFGHSTVDSGYDTEEEWAPNPYQADADAHYGEMIHQSSDMATAKKTALSTAALAFKPPEKVWNQGGQYLIPVFPCYQVDCTMMQAHAYAMYGNMNMSAQHLIAQKAADDDFNKSGTFQDNRSKSRDAETQNQLSRKSRAPAKQDAAYDAETKAGVTKKAQREPGNRHRLREILVQELAKDNHEIADSVKEWNVDTVQAVLHTIMQAFAKEGNVDKTERCADLVIYLGVSSVLGRTFNLVLGAFIKNGFVVKARNWWNRFTSLGVKPTLITYNTMLNVCTRAKDVVQAEWWMDRMMLNGIEPCLVSFTTIITACGQAGSVQKAEYWFERMRACGLQGDVVLHNAMIDAYSKSGELDKAEEMLQIMKTEGISPCQRTFNMLIHGCAKSGDMDRAVQWHGRMQKLGYRCDEYTYGSLIEGCALCRNIDLAESFIGRMFMEKLTPNLVCLRSLTKVYSSSGEYDRLAHMLTHCMQKGNVSRQVICEVLASNEARFKSQALQQLYTDNYVETNTVGFGGPTNRFAQRFRKHDSKYSRQRRAS
eukprot:TRINITY_DN37926_c0_g1_i1.p1 TRINITY_DN37926_c0_g1~~TRINITY_DN37926_c0_g1_i1.p1  ORF type:complete len:557 (-),score=91.49 TRINITY_DN37926_c0_g1_i1:305-1975(-)